MKNQDANIRWVIVLAFAQAEWQAYTGLLRAGVKAFLPYTLGHARRGRWTQGVVRPQYPGYLFAAIGGDTNTETIKRAVGVRDLLKDGKGLIYVSPAQIRDCKAKWIEAYRAAAPRVTRKTVVEVGMWLAVPHGPFAGAPCQVLSLDKSGNVCASIGTLQVSFRAQDVPQSVRASAKPEQNHRQ